MNSYFVLMTLALWQPINDLSNDEYIVREKGDKICAQHIYFARPLYRELATSHKECETRSRLRDILHKYDFVDKDKLKPLSKLFSKTVTINSIYGQCHHDGNMWQNRYEAENVKSKSDLFVWKYWRIGGCEEDISEEQQREATYMLAKDMLKWGFPKHIIISTLYEKVGAK